MGRLQNAVVIIFEIIKFKQVVHAVVRAFSYVVSTMQGTFEPLQQINQGVFLADCSEHFLDNFLVLLLFELSISFSSFALSVLLYIEVKITYNS